MERDLEAWKAQQEAKRAAAHREGPLDFLAGGGVVASRKDQEERRISDQLSLEAQKQHNVLVKTTMNALRAAIFPDEIAHFQKVLFTLNLTSEERQEFQKALWEKIK